MKENYRRRGKESARVFVSIPVPDKVKKILCKLVKKNKKLIQKSIDKKNWHITVLFIGEIKKDLVQTVVQKLETVLSKVTAFEAEITGCKIVSSPGKNQMFWATVKNGRNIKRVHDLVRKSLIIILPAISGCERKYVPHITLSRKVVRHEIKKLKKLDTDEKPKWQVNKIELLESKLQKDGAKYTKLASFQLKPKKENAMSKTKNHCGDLLGAHLSIEGGLEKSVETAEKLGFQSVQIFTKSSRSWTAKKLTKEEIKKFRETVKNSSVKFVVVHSSYLINLASSKKTVETKSTKSLQLELERCEQLGIPYLVLHPGAHTGLGEEEGIKQIAKNLDKVLAAVPGKTMILLENMAGQGTTIGSTIAQLQKIRKLSKNKRRIGICLDTCHAYAAGYDISTKNGYESLLEEIEKKIGLKKLKVIHVNDSLEELGSKKDRHANIGKGKIPQKAFEMLMNDERLLAIPKILETPTTATYRPYKNDVKKLKSMCKNLK